LQVARTFSHGWLLYGAGACLTRVRSILMRGTIAGTRRDRERPLPGPDTAEQVREVFELLRHHMNDVALALHATTSTNCNTRKPATRSRGAATVWYRFNQTALFPDRRPLPLASEPSFVETKKERRKGPDDDVARCLRGTRAAPKIARGAFARCGNPCCVRTIGRGLRCPAHRGAIRAVY
jgi:hypothetical protein